MAQTPEKKVKDAVARILKENCVYYFYPVTGGFGRSGIPDIVGCHRGTFIAIECKAGKNKPTALQLAEMAKIEKAGGMSMWVNEDSLYVVEELINLINGRFK
jgi:Holliday junction resolvase